MRQSLRGFIAALRARDPGTAAFTVLAGLVLAQAVIRGPLLVEDSASYIANAPPRTLSYPLFLDAMELVFGSGFGTAAVLLQVAFGAACAYGFGDALRADWGLARPAASAVSAIALIPLARFGPAILPESLAFGLFLWFAAVLSRTIALRSERSALLLSAAATLLISVRPQYLFVLPLLALVFAGLFLVSAPRRRGRILLFACAAVGIAGAGSLAQRAYGYAVHGSFAQVRVTGLQLLSIQLYLSSPSDEQVFDDPERRGLFASLSEALERDRLTQQSRDPRELIAGHYDSVYNSIISRVVRAYRDAHRSGPATTPDEGPDAREWLAMNDLFTAMALELIRAHPARTIRHVIRELYQRQRHFLLLVAVLPIVSGVLWLRHRDPFWALVGLIGLAGLSNYALVVLVQPILMRYAYPTDTVVVATLVAALLRDRPSPDHS